MSAIIDRFVTTGWERQAYGGKVPTMTHTVTEAALHTRPHPAPGHRRVVLKLSGEVFGAGVPFFSTDTVAAQRALEIHADTVLMSKNGVDGVYSADPRTNPDAYRLDTVTFEEALRRGLRVVDAAAFSLCQDNKLPMLVFGSDGEDTIVRALSGERI